MVLPVSGSQCAGGDRLSYTPLIPRAAYGQAHSPRHLQCKAIAAPPVPEQRSTNVSRPELLHAPETAGWFSNEEETSVPAVSPSREDKHYNWSKQWYPVAIIKDLNPRKPHAVLLLDLNLVVWRDSQQQWRCFEDRCPHRLAPLSEGRIEPSDGSLFCNYHGWRFRGDGACAGIPQLPASQSGALGNPRACAVSYPTQEVEGLLWVWPSAGQNAQAEADAAGYPGMCPQLDSGQAKPLIGGWYFRDTHSHWLSGKENAFTDPSHDGILHHGTAGKREAAAPLYVAATEMNASGYSVSYARSPPNKAAQQSPLAPSAPSAEHDSTSSKKGRQAADAKMFAAFTDTTKMPVGAMRTINVPKTGQLLMFGYFVPLGANLTRHFINFATGSPEMKGPPALRLMGRLPVWGTHLYMHTILDADVATQAGVDRNRRLGKGNDVFVPAASDRGVVMLQRWLHKYAGDTLPVPEVEPPALSRRELMDRFHMHTEQCPACMQAFKTVSLIQKVAAAAAAALLVAAAASVAVRGLAWPSIACALGCALSGLAVAACSWLVKQFTFRDYSFEEKHTSKGS